MCIVQEGVAARSAAGTADSQRNEMKKLDFTHIHFGWQTSYVLDDLHKMKPFTTNTAVFSEAQVPSKQLEYDV